MKISVRVRIIDVKTGHVDYDEESHSWVKQAGQWYGAAFKGSVSLVDTVRDITGALITVSGNYIYLLTAGSGELGSGIVVGISDSAEAITNYKLGNLIAHGSGVGQLSYATHITLDPFNVSGTMSLILQRIITNLSGDTIILKEIALYLSVATKTFCLLRDVLASPINVADGATKLCQYIVQVVN